MELDPKVRDNILMHYGILRRSGRYPYGSGGDPYQSAVAFQQQLKDLRTQGLSDSQIAQGLGIKTTDLRDHISIARETVYEANRSMAYKLKNEKQMSTRAIAERMLGDASKESTVRGWLKSAEKIKDDTITAISNLLGKHVEEKRFVDVGKGNELYMGVSDTRLRAAITQLKDDGYKVWSVKLPQLGTDKLTEHKILGLPDTSWKEAKDALLNGKVYLVKEKFDDIDLSFMKPKSEPVSVSSKRLEVRYGDEGGSEKDGVIELRRGVPELDLGSNNYAQVRIAVDGTHYLKGMAMYTDDLPAGTDIRFNTNKNRGVPVIGPKDNTILKPLSDKPEDAGNRWGAITRPHVYKDADGKVHTSALNFVNEEGDWDRWSDNLSTQMLSKQSVSLAARQLAKVRSTKEDQLKEIMSLTNPVVKKKLLMEFADSVDSDSIHLKAAPIKDQSTHVILPMNSMRPNEIYAPKFNNGEKVALVRYPHSGPFEIPQLTVNNNNRTAKKIMGTALDAVGIHHSVAQQLSGADFDGDTVLVIPNNSGRVKSKPPLAELKDFDPKAAYPASPGMTKMTKANTQKEMGKIANLINDMTIKGASTSEIAKAVKHSMVVIDAEKHSLNYKQSEVDNEIKSLKDRYQLDPNNPTSRGASTLISRTSSQATVPQVRLRRQSEGGAIDPKTGELVYVPTGSTYRKYKTDPKTGERTYTTVPKLTKTQKGSRLVTKDARTLSSGTEMEEVYAQHSNYLRSMANTARKATLSIKDPTQSTAAKAYYAKEVESLKAKLKTAQMNAPLERRAQAIATATASARIATRPDIDADTIKKIKYQSLTDARNQTGASKIRIGSASSPITIREWAAIQSGAISSTMLREILNNSDMDAIKSLATPKYNSSLTPGQIALAKTMANSGRSLSEIATALGIPRSTIADNLANA